MKRIGTIVENGVVTGLIHGPDACNQVIIVNGRQWRFDFDEWCGPLWLKKDGSTPRKNQCPPDRVWKVWSKWQKKWDKAQSQ
jgi:hypothetical protein